MPMIEDLLKNLGVAETWLTSNIRWPIFKLRLYKHNFRCSRVWESRLSRIWTKKVTQSISQGGEACQGSFQTPGRGGIWEITKIIFGPSECSSLITTSWTIVTTKRRLILCWIGVTNLSSVVLLHIWQKYEKYSTYWTQSWASTWSEKTWYWPRSSQHLLLGIYHSILIVMKVMLSWLSRNGPVGVTFLFSFPFWFQVDNHLHCSRLQFQGQRENFYALDTIAAFSVPLSPLCKAVFGIAPGQ